MIKIRNTPTPCQISVKSFTGLSSREVVGEHKSNDVNHISKRGGVL